MSCLKLNATKYSESKRVWEVSVKTFLQLSVASVSSVA